MIRLQLFFTWILLPQLVQDCQGGNISRTQTILLGKMASWIFEPFTCQNQMESGLFWKYHGWFYGTAQRGQIITITMDAETHHQNRSWSWWNHPNHYGSYHEGIVQTPNKEYCDTTHWITTNILFIVPNWSRAAC